ncbi:MAG: Flp pilus assembly protein CpaB [Pseudomonadota bacterium]
MIILIVVALAIAGTVAFLVSRFLSETEEAARNVEPTVVSESTVDVLVAAKSLPIGRIVRDDDLRWQSWPEQSVSADYITKGSEDGRAEIGEFVGSAVRVEMVGGEPVLSSKVFHRGDAGFLSGVLTPGMRAVTIAVTARSGTAGFILPGDRVDVLMVFDIPTQDPVTGDTANRVISETALENIRVLAIDQAVSMGTGEEGSNETLADVAETVTLEVTPNQAQALAVANQMGALSLSLRSRVEGALSEIPRSFSPDFAVSSYLGRNMPEGTRVLVASRDLAEGTLLNDQDWQWASMPADQVQFDWIVEGVSDPNALRSGLLLQDLEGGQPITAAELLLPNEDRYIETALEPGMRAITVPVDETRGVSGFVMPGAYVDVIYNLELEDQSDEPIKDPRRFSEMFLENIRVLHIERVFDNATGVPAIDPQTLSATLEVTPSQAELIALALSEGTLTLVLRGDEPGGETRLADYTSDFEASRAMVDLLYGLTLPPPPKGFGNDSVLIYDETLNGDAGQVRVYRSTIPQDLIFSGSGG